MRRLGVWMVMALLGGVCASNAQAFVITPTYLNAAVWTDDQKAVVQAAITDWTSRVAFEGDNDQQINVTLYQVAAGTGSGAFLSQWQFNQLNITPFPYSPGILHYIVINSDYLTLDSFDVNGPVQGRYDMLSAITHEFGHLLGFAPGVYFDTTNPDDPQKWRSHLSGDPGSVVFDAGGLNVPMSDDGAHVNVPGDLMYFSLDGNVRRTISDTDLQMLSLAYGYTILPVPEPGSLGMLLVGCAGLLMRKHVRNSKN